MQTGFTVILIPRGEGVSTKPIKTAYSSTAGTAYVTFDKVIIENFAVFRLLTSCRSVYPSATLSVL